MNSTAQITQEDRHERILARAQQIIASSPIDPVAATQAIVGIEDADRLAEEWGDWTLARDAAAHRKAVMEIGRDG